MKTLADYIKAVQLEEGTDLHAQAEAHLSKANDADAKGDNYGYHMHMANHHEALSQWHDSKGRGGLAAKHEDLAAKHEDKAEDAREASSKRGVKEAYGGLRGNVGDRSKREFKHRELEHELGHEVNPRATFSRPSSSDVPHAVHIDGKKWKTFGSQSHATNVARKIPGATVHKEEYVAEGFSEMDNRTPSGDRREQRANSPEAKAQREKEQQERLKKVSPEMRKKLGLPEPKEQGVAEGMNDWALKDKPKAKSIPQTSGMNSYAMKGDVHNKAYDFPPTHYDKDGKDMYGRKKPEAK